MSTILTWVLGIVGGIVGTASAWLYRRLHGPKLEVSLEPVLSCPDPEYGIPEQSPRKFKSQTLRVKAKRRLIPQCKVKMVIDGETDYLFWNPKSTNEGKDLLPEEEVQLQVWQAVRAPEHELLYLNTRNKTEVDIKGLNYSITGEISFLSEDVLLNKKPYRYKISINSWDTVTMVMNNGKS